MRDRGFKLLELIALLGLLAAILLGIVAREWHARRADRQAVETTTTSFTQDVAQGQLARRNETAASSEPAKGNIAPRLQGARAAPEPRAASASQGESRALAPLLHEAPAETIEPSGAHPVPSAPGADPAQVPLPQAVPGETYRGWAVSLPGEPLREVPLDRVQIQIAKAPERSDRNGFLQVIRADGVHQLLPVGTPDQPTEVVFLCGSTVERVWISEDGVSRQPPESR